jgi:hypothetical protein
MKNFTKRDWLLLSVSASLALFGVLYNEHVIKPELLLAEYSGPVLPYNETWAGEHGVKYLYPNGTLGEPPGGKWNIIPPKKNP